LPSPQSRPGTLDPGHWEEKVIPLSTLLAATNPRPAGTNVAANHDYWLARCEGFRVQSADGGIGVIERVGYRSSPAHAAFLLVRSGVLGGTALVVDADDVLEVDARRRKVRLRRGYRATGVATRPGLISRLRHQLTPHLPRRVHP
jgi:hypothetical protein